MNFLLIFIFVVVFCLGVNIALFVVVGLFFGDGGVCFFGIECLFNFSYFIFCVFGKYVLMVTIVVCNDCLVGD